MLLTPKQAEAKWCPFARTLVGNKIDGEIKTVGGITSFNRIRENAGSRHLSWEYCVGEKCMAWRWKQPPGPTPPDAPERDDRGWCGLAGISE